jgi:hypothetical protein
LAAPISDDASWLKLEEYVADYVRKNILAKCAAAENDASG